MSNKVKEVWNKVTANGCREMDEVRFEQACNELIDSIESKWEEAKSDVEFYIWLDSIKTIHEEQAFKSQSLPIRERFEKETGFASWINSDIYSNGRIDTQEYVKWLESKM